MVELTFDIDPEKDVREFEDDAEADIATRALARVRPALDEMIGGDKAFAHYHVIELPKRVFD